jgi:alpha-D-ribose 1-methylphosphonate 5-triphosphate synthase subunit PhnG
MRHDRELIALAKSRNLETIADQLQRSPDYIIKRATRLGLTIKGRKANKK